MKMTVAMTLLALALGNPAGALAQSEVANFYKGKTITLFVGSEPGGGYDGDARIVARHLGRHIPGGPGIIVQNMPGARGITSANNLYNLAKRDGTVMAIIERDHLIDPYLMPEGVRYDERKFGWIGSTGSEQGVAIAWHTAPQKSAEDLRRMEMVVGGNSFSGLLPRIFNVTMGTKFRTVTGYPGSGAVLLAMQKGEVQGIANYSLSNLVAKHADWLADRSVTVLFQTGVKRDAALPDVPSAFDLALDAEKREVLDLWLSPNEVARPFAMPPEVPPDRLAAVRKAFMALFQDAAFLADAAKTGMVIAPQDGAAIERLVARLRALPPKILELSRRAAVN